MKKILIAFLLLTFMTPAFVATPALAADSIDMTSNVACTQKTKPMDIYKIRSQNNSSCEQARNNWLTSVKQNALAAHCNKKSTPNLQFTCSSDNTLESYGCTEICDSNKRQVAGRIYCVYLNNNEDIYDVPVLEITQDTAGKFSAQLKQNSHSAGQNKTSTSTITCKTSDSYKSNNQKSSGGNTNQSTSTSNNTAQSSNTNGSQATIINGYVYDSATNEALMSATIVEYNQCDKEKKSFDRATINQENYGTTDMDGNFQITEPDWQSGHCVVISYMGYQNEVIFDNQGLTNIALKEEAITTEDAEIEDKSIKKNQKCTIYTSDNKQIKGTMQPYTSIQKVEGQDKEMAGFACQPKSPYKGKDYEATTGAYGKTVRTCTDDNGHITQCDDVYCTTDAEKRINDVIGCLPNDRTRYISNGNVFQFNLDNKACPREILSTLDKHATAGTIAEYNKETGEVTQCESTQCDAKDFKPTKPNGNVRCIQSECPKQILKRMDKNAIFGIVTNVNQNGEATECEIQECDGLYVPASGHKKCINTTCPCKQEWDYDQEWDKDGAGCISQIDPNCLDTLKKNVYGVTQAQWACNKKNKNYCKITECADGWKLDPKDENNRCINIYDCLDWGRTNDPDRFSNVAVASWSDKAHTTCLVKACSDSRYRVNTNANKCELKGDADIGELKSKAEQAKQNERSLENRISGAVGIGGVGIGGMMIGGALSEQAADEYAESDMAAYINTFRCEYGDGQTVAGGERNVTLPGGNELIDVYTQYARLSNDLKNRKTSLGLKPGIESEVIIDKSTSGLYDDVGVGVVGGGYASIARALLFPGGADAAAWDAQKAATASKLNTGIAVAGTAAALTLAQSLRDAFNKPVEQLQKEIQEIPAESCSKYTGTTGHGDINTPCQCANTDERFFRDQDGCVPCPAGLEYNKYNDCVCKKGTFEDEENPGTCITINTPVKCPLSGANIFFNDDGTCRCNDDAIQESDNTCTKCSYGIADDGQTCNPEPEKPQPGTVIFQLGVDGDALFTNGSYELKNTDETNNASTKLAKFSMDAMTAAVSQNINLQQVDYCLVIIGHTDRQKYQNDPQNEKNYRLSENRANTVKTELTNVFDENKILTYGVADRDCTTEEHPKANDKTCRKVEMILLAGSCQAGTDYSVPENRSQTGTIITGVQN